MKRFCHIVFLKDLTKRKLNLLASLQTLHLPRSHLVNRISRYGRIVERIENNENLAERDQALMLLGWVVTAKRPLTWPEIQGAVSIDLEQQTVDFEERQLVVDIGELCGSLVERLAGDRIELVHTSAKMRAVRSLNIRCMLT